MQKFERNSQLCNSNSRITTTKILQVSCRQWQLISSYPAKVHFAEFRVQLHAFFSVFGRKLVIIQFTFYCLFSCSFRENVNILQFLKGRVTLFYTGEYIKFCMTGFRCFNRILSRFCYSCLLFYH